MYQYEYFLEALHNFRYSKPHLYERSMKILLEIFDVSTAINIQVVVFLVVILFLKMEVARSSET
jgi:hypothetical protein